MRSETRRLLPSLPIPEYVAVDLAEPQSAVEARLRGTNVDLDVTFNTVLVSFRPLYQSYLERQGRPL